MKSNVYCIFDSKSESYHPPTLQPNHATAIRAAENILKNPQSQITQTPEDFSIFHIGQFDDNTGKVTSREPLEHVANFHEIAAQLNNEE